MVFAMSEAREGVKIDRIEFTFNIPEGIPEFETVEDATAYFGRSVSNGIKSWRFSIKLADDVVCYFSNRRGNARIAPGKLVIGSASSNKIPISNIASRVHSYLPSWINLRRICRIDIASDVFIPFDEFCIKIAPLGMDKSFCYAHYVGTHGRSFKDHTQTFQVGKKETVLRLYNKQAEQGVDFAWSRAEFQFRGKIIRYTGNVPTDSSCLETVLQLVGHGLQFFRPCSRYYETNPNESIVSPYWLGLFSAIADPVKLRRNTVYYV